MNNKIKIQFLGASGTVTGSKYLISVLDKNILIDCGMFQGLKELRLLNWKDLPIEAAKIDKVLITHGHYDHCGYLPRLVSSGFSGEIITTSPTIEVATAVLKDSAKIQVEEAQKANREGYSKHKPAKPFYDIEDVLKTISLFSPVEEGKWIELYKNIKIKFNYVGHIIGACFIEIQIGTKKFVFSGDIGRDNDVLMRNPKKPENGNFIFIESTYGDKLHSNNAIDKFIEIINYTIKKNGTLIIPSFAVERAQSIMYLLWSFLNKNLIPDITVYLDSPMGSNIMDIFKKNIQWHKLSSQECQSITERIKIISSIKKTLKLAGDNKPKIIIAGGGMASGGRVLTYMQKYLGDKNSTVLFVGYQAEGTRGRKLLEGIKEIKIYGKHYPVKAKIENIGGLSSHADQKGLLGWLSEIKSSPDKIFIVHGESEPARVLKTKIEELYGWECKIPSLFEEFETDLIL